MSVRRAELYQAQSWGLFAGTLTTAGAAGLGFLSYIMGIHSATYSRADGGVKQIGFLWAPNWTFLFMVLLPLFSAFVIELLVFWKHDARFRLVAPGRATFKLMRPVRGLAHMRLNPYPENRPCCTSVRISPLWRIAMS